MIGTYSRLNIKVDIIEVDHIAVDVEEALDEPEDVVPPINKIKQWFFHLDEANPLKEHGMIAHVVKCQTDV